ncbi:hypothetical protein BOTCAL_0238g00010 [Botryotinia calthae]|uniref:Uncharacterized protein n=1 Tax=Botryotinia calthae TaxID=38488 RepID=A0A4Y8CZH4_9HELO|nr:hypothetical protein BOTCAL_0238g00010 [Botryotinia calthae]
MCFYRKITYQKCQRDTGPHQTATCIGPCPEVDKEKKELSENIDRTLIGYKKRTFRRCDIKSNKTDECPVCANKELDLDFDGPWEDEIVGDIEPDPQKSTNTGNAVAGGTVAGGTVAGGTVAGGTVAGGTVAGGTVP